MKFSQKFESPQIYVYTDIETRKFQHSTNRFCMANSYHTFSSVN